MKTLAAAVLLAMQAGQPVEMTVHVGDQVAGTATITETITEDKGKKVNIRINLGQVTVTQEAEYDNRGAPTRKYIRQTGAGGEMRLATFRSNVANVIVEKVGMRSVENVVAPEGARIQAASELWFLVTKPTVGQTDRYHRFDMSRLEWIETTARYEGPENISIGGKTVRAHKVTLTGVGDSWLDDSGRPLRLEAGSLRMVAKL